MQSIWLNFRKRSVRRRDYRIVDGRRILSHLDGDTSELFRQNGYRVKVFKFAPMPPASGGMGANLNTHLFVRDFGAAQRTLTADLRLTKALLYLLS